MSTPTNSKTQSSDKPNQTTGPSGAPPAIFEKVLQTADRVAAELAKSAAARDRANQTPRAEVELLRQNELLQVQEPTAYGGSGLNYAQASIVTRRIARGDTSIAHLIGYHFAQTRIARLFGTPEQADAQSRRNGKERLFWGGVQNPRGGSALELSRDSDGQGFRVNGQRTFASGASLGDLLSVTTLYEGRLQLIAIPGNRPGFVPLHNWDNIGQRLTDSGGVEFRDVRVEPGEVLGDPAVGHAFTPYQTLVTPHWQLAFVNFYIGTAEGALAEAIDWTRKNGVPWESSGVTRATDDPFIQETVGEIVSEVRAAALLADRAGEALQHALDIGPGLTAEERAEAAVAVYEAKLLTTKVALSATSRLFEIQGARATTTAYGFDRHWRNVRTHTVHDPVAYKAKEIGDFVLNGRAPEFSLYR